ncbi:MAG TPA: hypothetical protein PK839_10550 [Tenuifilaceae bacterium]|nr:hypothetical protein [Tenuifilaceae bacterium]HOY72877.1 hypothetical protein [Tenuifilaceae bacterium]HPM89368.1 hypothetical protein [Tenuifilaceae bacterium]
MRMLSVAYLVATSCCTVLYIPNSYNSPLLRGKEDARANFPAGTPGFMSKMGYKRVRFYTCIGVSLPFTHL